MGFLLDKKYASYISSRLERFTWLRPNLSAARCPFCGDSKKKKLKRRFYFYQNAKSGSLADHLSVKCHNCQYTEPFSVFLKAFDSALYKEYSLENFKERSSSFRRRREDAPTTLSHVPSFDLMQRFIDILPDSCVPLCSLPDDHDAVQQMRARQLNEWFMKELWYAENFNEVIAELRPDIEINSIPEPRVVIPFYNQNKQFTMVQGRSLKKNSELRYVSIKIDDAYDKIYGLDRADLSKPLYVVEGPIDSTFIDNCVATADSNLTNANKYSDKLILIHDNQYRNRELCKQIDSVIVQNYEVVLFPPSIVYKDINDMVKDGKMSTKEIKDIIDSNRFKGLSARLRFRNLTKGVL